MRRIALAVGLLPLGLSAQFLNFLFVDGTTRSESTAGLRRVLVTPASYEVHRDDGAVFIWPVDSVVSIQVGDVATSSGVLGAHADAFSIHPVPVTRASVLTHTVPVAGIVQFLLIDLQGRVVRGTGDLMRNAGTHSEQLLALLDPEGTLPQGTYLCSVHTAQATSTRSILIQY